MCAVEGGRRMDGLAVCSSANLKHPVGMYWGPKNCETSLQKVIYVVHVFC